MSPSPASFLFPNRTAALPPAMEGRRPSILSPQVLEVFASRLTLHLSALAVGAMDPAEFLAVVHRQSAEMGVGIGYNPPALAWPLLGLIQQQSLNTESRALICRNTQGYGARFATPLGLDDLGGCTAITSPKPDVYIGDRHQRPDLVISVYVVNLPVRFAYLFLYEKSTTQYINH
jgi:hypothetical protein